MADIKKIVNSIAELNNLYREASSSTKTKLEALWQIGEELVKLNVSKPHTVGWAVQKETRGLIKRPTVFRSFKIRAIWGNKNELLRDLGGIKAISNLTEILPLIDPAQKVRSNLSKEQLNDIYRHACSDSSKSFKNYINGLKHKFSYGRLGQPLNRDKHLKELDQVIKNLKELFLFLEKIINDTEASSRIDFREKTAFLEREVFSNMCIALTTKENIKLYKGKGPEESSSNNQAFQFLYKYFRDILRKESDIERARLRRLVSAEVLAQISDIVSSINSEESIKDFKARQRISINL